MKDFTDIIPPNDYSHRNGFSNHKTINNLNKGELLSVENELINRLKENFSDSLIIETLSYINSYKALPFMYKLLDSDYNSLWKIILAVSIFLIDSNRAMVTIALNNFYNIINKYQIIDSFYYLNQFNDSEVNKIISGYIDSPDILLSYNARQALGICFQ